MGEKNFCLFWKLLPFLVEIFQQILKKKLNNDFDQIWIRNSSQGSLKYFFKCISLKIVVQLISIKTCLNSCSYHYQILRMLFMESALQPIKLTSKSKSSCKNLIYPNTPLENKMLEYSIFNSGHIRTAQCAWAVLALRLQHTIVRVRLVRFGYRSTMNTK